MSSDVPFSRIPLIASFISPWTISPLTDSSLNSILPSFVAESMFTWFTSPFPICLSIPLILVSFSIAILSMTCLEDLKLSSDSLSLIPLPMWLRSSVGEGIVSPGESTLPLTVISTFFESTHSTLSGEISRVPDSCFPSIGAGISSIESRTPSSSSSMGISSSSGSSSSIPAMADMAAAVSSAELTIAVVSATSESDPLDIECCVSSSVISREDTAASVSSWVHT